MKYKHFGVMLDCSRNAVMKVSEVKRFIDLMVKAGYDTLELYTEDTYAVDGEPYFGYMRGRYSHDELKEIDAYAKKAGVELIPCVQTLAHFNNLVKLNPYWEITDVFDILLVDDERTYELIDHIFATLAECFTSRLVNIGMDEAHLVGLGKYLDKHGFTDRFEVLLRHLSRVVDIAKKYGFTPHMWSDMFFRMANHGEYYGENKVPDTVVKKMPKEIELTYWDYYHIDKKGFDDMFEAHLATGKNIWFAGGAWVWNGFAPMNFHTLKTMRPAMRSVREHKIENVFITMWGDNGKECSFYAALPALYAVRKFADGIEDEEEIKKGFKKTFGLDYDDFMLLDLPNVTPKTKDIDYIENPCKSLLYTDCFMNSFEPMIVKEGRIDYTSHCKRLTEAAARAGEYKYVFETLASLCSVLEIKAELSLWTKAEYRSGDRKRVKALCKQYDELVKRLEKFYDLFSALWEKENKPFGWEIQDARLGGLMQRVKRCRNVLNRYADGELDSIPELEETTAMVTCWQSFQNNEYRKLISVSDI